MEISYSTYDTCLCILGQTNARIDSFFIHIMDDSISTPLWKTAMVTATNKSNFDKKKIRAQTNFSRL